MAVNAAAQRAETWFRDELEPARESARAEGRQTVILWLGDGNLEEVRNLYSSAVRLLKERGIKAIGGSSPPRLYIEVPA